MKNLQNSQRFRNRIKLYALFILCAVSPALQAQEEQRKTVNTHGHSVATKSVIIGYAYSDFCISPGSDVKTNFTRIGFSPTMIWKLTDKLFFESQVEFNTDSGHITTVVEYAKLSYIYNKYITIGMGKILTPFGTYTERFEAPFIERLPNTPLGFRHLEESPNIGPVGSEMGVDVRGGFQVGNSKMNYDIYVTNGARLNDGSHEPKLAGAIEYENFFDNNTNKAIGCRVGYLPFSNSSLEIGGSFNYSKAGDAKSVYEDVLASAYSADISYQKAIIPMKTLLNIKGQINQLYVDKANYLDELGTAYTFDNSSNIYYVRVSLRPALIKNKYLKKVEILGRYNSANFAKHALWGGITTRNDIGLAYWLSVSTGLRIAYESTHYADGTTGEMYLVRFVTGF